MADKDPSGTGFHLKLDLPRRKITINTHNTVGFLIALGSSKDPSEVPLGFDFEVLGFQNQTPADPEQVKIQMKISSGGISILHAESGRLRLTTVAE